MAKLRIETILKTAEKVFKNNVLAIISNNTFKYSEDGVIVTIKILDDEVVMIRDNDEYRLELKFQKNKKTTSSYLLKKENILLDLEIYTEELETKPNLKIKYHLNDEVREYLINIKE